MLHTQTVEPQTLSLLKKLMSMPQLNDFCLVGGTALSLKLGHRISIDLDLFQTAEIEVEPLIKLLQQEFKSNFEYENLKINYAVFCKINKVKVDLVQYSHPIIADIEMVDGIRMYSDKDIAAMKINAILGRGVKKDFWDLFELLKLYSLNDIINFYNQKYPNQQLLISIPNALTYFEDADDSPDPIGLLGQTWEDVKEFIRARVSDFLKY
jgi:predicted nucleotidyltransferase component of viral defense system